LKTKINYKQLEQVYPEINHHTSDLLVHCVVK